MFLFLYISLKTYLTCIGSNHIAELCYRGLKMNIQVTKLTRHIYEPIDLFEYTKNKKKTAFVNRIAHTCLLKWQHHAVRTSISKSSICPSSFVTSPSSRAIWRFNPCIPRERERKNAQRNVARAAYALTTKIGFMYCFQFQPGIGSTALSLREEFLGVGVSAV